MKYINSQPLSHIVDFTEPEGEGDKKIIRLLARRYGLFTCQSLPKRAIQFGSKVVTQFAKGNGTDEFLLPEKFVSND